MLKTILFFLVLLLGINAVLAWQNLRTEMGTDADCPVAAARKAAGDSGGLMLPASSVLFKSINLFK